MAAPFRTTPTVRRLIPILLLPLCAGLAARAQAPRKAADALSRSPFTAVREKTLPNGLKVLALPRRTAPVVTTMMWYRVGSREEVPGATGLAHLLEHLLFKGTRKLKKGEIDRITYQLGGSNNAFTFNDYTAYEFNLPRSNWKRALEIEADRMRNSRIDRAEFEAERKVVMEERRGGQDDPANRFFEQLQTQLFTAHPYRNPVIGWMEDLRRVTRDDVYAFYQRYYTPSNATLVVAGDVSPDEAFAAAAQAFRAVTGPRASRPAISEPEPVRVARRMRVTLPSQVARVVVAFPLPGRASPDGPALELLSSAFGTGRLSRLHQRLVERDRTAAEVDSYLGLYRDAGELSLGATLRDGATPELAESAIWDEVERLAAVPPDARELERLKNQWAASWVDDLETANDLASTLGEWDALGVRKALDTLPARIRAVTAEQLRAAAARYLRRDRSVVGYLDPDRPDPSGGSIVAPVPRRTAPAPAGRTAPPRPAAAGPPVTVRPARTDQPFASLSPMTARLPNGVRLILLENRDLPAVTLTARITAGSYRDPAGAEGTAALLARMLDEGTPSRSHQEISEALEQVGAKFTVVAGGETTLATLRCLSPSLDDLLPLAAEMVRRPTLPPDRLALERGRMEVELRESLDDSATVATRAFRALVYGDHPAGRPSSGTLESLPRLDRDLLAGFHARWFRPERTTIVAVGDFRAAALRERLAALFGDWEGAGPAETEDLPPVRLQAGPATRRVPMDKTQSQIRLGHLGITRTDPDYLALQVLDSILGEGVGGGFTARIPYQLRDVQGLAYGVWSSITSSAGKIPGMFVAAMGTEPKNEERAVAALLAEIRRIRQAPVTETELREATNYLASSYVFRFQTQEQLASYLLLTDYYGLGFDYRNRYVRAVRRITREQVLAAARKHLHPERRSLVVVGPERKQ